MMAMPASEPPPHPFGKPTSFDDTRDWYVRRRRAPRKFDAAAVATMYQAWETGDAHLRETVISYVASRLPPGGEALVWQALAAGDPYGTAGVGAEGYISQGYVPTESETAMLVAVTLDQSRDSLNRQLALLTLGAVEFEGLDALVKELANDPNADLRFQANLHLLHLGEDVRDHLFADLEAVADKRGALDRLWTERNRLALRPEEESAEGYRRSFRNTEWNHSDVALVLFHHIKSGLPYELTDIDMIGEAALREHSHRMRLKAVEALIWFNNDRSREWLYKLANQNQRPGVRRRAAKLLRQQNSQRKSQ
jgi:hypothetical protein